MTTSTQPRELVAEDLSILRDYAKQVFEGGASLSTVEEDDRTRRMHEYLAIGSSFKLTEHEMVIELYRGLLGPKRGCGCHPCKMRLGRRAQSLH